MKKLFQRRSAPQRPRAIQTSRHLHVAHRRHTGHVTPRRTTSYPSLVMIVLCVGVFLASWTHFVTADSASGTYTVQASVPGPPPTQAPTIDASLDGKVFTTSPITLSGNCEVNTYETLYRNNVFSGVALCSASGSYSMQTDLFAGTNQLQTRVFSTSDTPGPLSTVVTVTYNPPPSPPANGGGGTSSGSSSASSSSNSSTGSSGTSKAATQNSTPSSSAGASMPLIFKDTYSYQGYYTGENITWTPDIEGGVAPYAISVDWGDGSHSLVSIAHAGNFSLSHTYSQAGGYKGSYIVKLTASDAVGLQTFMQLLVLINNPPAGGVSGGTTGRFTGPISNLSSNTGITSGLSNLIWPGYGVTLLMLTSFWLGERRELSFVHVHVKRPTRPRARR